MRRLGIHDTGVSSSSPSLCIIAYDGISHIPSLCLTQESLSDLPAVKVGAYTLNCTNILDEVTIKSIRPTSGGGLRRNTCNVSFKTEHINAHPFVREVFSKELYYGGKNYESIYFVVYSFDRVNQDQDVRLGACYGAFQINDDLGWNEEDGMMTLSMIDILTAQEQIAGATNEPIDDIFYIYNPWYQESIFPKTYGQIPRIKALNAFPSFDLKKLASSVTGTLHTAYGTGGLVGTVLVLEEDVSVGSLLLQLVAVGGVARIKFENGEVMSGTLSHDTVNDQIKFTITLRNTYYNQVKAWTDSKDGRTPPQWGPNPNYTDVDFAVNATIIPDAKDVVLDPEGWMQASINFYDPAEFEGNRAETNIATQMQGLLEERKDSVLHKFWPDPDNVGLVTHSTISCFFDNTVGNETYLSPDIVPLWGFDSFRFMNFYKVGQNVRLFFISPSLANVAGVVGDSWALVNIEPSSVDYSCYIRNGFSLFSNDHVYCEGEGRLIKIPTGNISSVTQSGTYYGLTNLCKIALTTSPLNMDIGATSNVVYIDALYKEDNVQDGWLPSILSQIIIQECSGGVEQLMSSILENRTFYGAENKWPYIGVHIKSSETVTTIIDKICYQTGVSSSWAYGEFDFPITSRSFASYDLVEVAGPIKYVRPNLASTDKYEMLEKTASLSIGKLKTFIDATNDLEHIQLHFPATYGGWEDPHYNPVKSQINRTLKPRARLIEYHYDYINDPDSFKQATSMSLAIGSASGYASVQRRVTTEMAMTGCRWEALDGIIFKDYPLLSTEESNVVFDVNNNVMYNKPIVIESGKDIVSPNFLMGAVGCVDEAEYVFSILKPFVRVTARMSQLMVDDVTGIVYYNSPGAPKKPKVPNKPNVPPTQGAGGLWLNGGGNSFLMPEILTEAAEVVIDSTDLYTTSFTLTVDSGWLFDLGWSWSAEVIDTKETAGVTIQAGGYSGVFVDKVSEAYVPTIYTIDLNVYYFWFDGESLGTTSRECKIKFTRIAHLTRDPASDTVEDYFYVTIPIRRVPLADVDIS